LNSTRFLSVVIAGPAFLHPPHSTAEARQLPDSQWEHKYRTSSLSIAKASAVEPGSGVPTPGNPMVTQAEARNSLLGKIFVHYDGYPPNGIPDGLAFHFEGADGIIDKPVVKGYDMFRNIKRPFTITSEDRFQPLIDGSFQLAGWGVCKTYQGQAPYDMLVETKCRWTLNFSAREKMYQFGAGQFTGYYKSN
jgi:hypothetical protein